MPGTDAPAEYRRRRDGGRTREPGGAQGARTGGGSAAVRRPVATGLRRSRPGSGEPRSVAQSRDATTTHLHLRPEIDGGLTSARSGRTLRRIAERKGPP